MAIIQLRKSPSPPVGNSLPGILFSSPLIILALLVLVLFQSACVKKRDPTFPDGTGKDLLSVSEYDSREEVLETKDAKGPVFSVTGQTLAEQESSRIKIVDYSTDAPLFPKDLELAGLAKTTYKLIYKIVGQKLIIYRNSDEGSVTSDEKLVAETESDRSYSVALVSYPVTGFYRVVVAKDDNGDETTRLKEETVANKEDATHFRISKIPEIVGLQELGEQILKANFFDGTWYSTTTVAKSTEEASSLLTKQNPFAYNWNDAVRVQFAHTRDTIIGLNANYDRNSAPADNIKALLKIPVKYFDPKTLSATDTSTKNADSPALKTKDRKWAIISLKDAKSDAIDSLAKQENSPPILTAFRASDDFFIFSLQVKGSRLTSSFIRESAVKKITEPRFRPKAAPTPGN